MECPACGRTLTSRTVGDLTVDVCEGGCGGIWFDWLELRRVDEPDEHLGESLLDVARDPTLQVDPKRRRTCPRCPGMTLMRHFYSVRKKVEVDECPKCGGGWLDYGELASIRKLFASEEERKKAAIATFDELFDEELERMHQDSAEQIEKARRIASILALSLPEPPRKQKR